MHNFFGKSWKQFSMIIFEHMYLQPNAILANSDDLFGITVISSICADNGKQCATKRY